MKNVSERYRESAQKIKELIKAHDLQVMLYDEKKESYRKHKKYLPVGAHAAADYTNAELEEQERIHSLLAKEVQDNSHNNFELWWK